MQQVMTGWIEAADAREVCEQAMAEQMLGRTPAQSVEPWSLAAMLRLHAWLGPVNRRLGLGGTARADH
jgi:hypothetical protein